MKNPRIGSIERVGKGYIVYSHDPIDPDFFDGKLLLNDFDSLVEFLGNHLGSVGRSTPSLPVVVARKSNGNGAHTDPANEYEVRQKIDLLLNDQEDPQQLLPLPVLDQPSPQFIPLQETYESRAPISFDQA